MPPLSGFSQSDFTPHGGATRGEIEAFVQGECLHYFHPVGLADERASDRSAVVDSRGKIQGLENAYVADA